MRRIPMVENGCNGARRNGAGDASPEGLNQRRVELAKECIEKLARRAISEGQNGTIGVEIPVKDGQLGRVKRLEIAFEQD